MKTIILVGKMGSGKTTVAQYLRDNYGYEKIRTCTTRKPRNRQDLKDYRFLNKREFMSMEKAGVFAETSKGSNLQSSWYGSLKEDYIPKDDSDKKVVVLDPQGAYNVSKSVGKENVEIVYLYADTSVLLDRLQNRGTESLDDCKTRLNKEESIFDKYFGDDLAYFQFLKIDTNNMDVEAIANIIFQRANDLA